MQTEMISDELIWAMSFGTPELDPAPFVKRWVKTRNEAIKNDMAAYQSLPVEMFHLQVINEFMFETGRFADPMWRSSTKLMPKGRQMMVTWDVLGSGILYPIIKYPGSRIGIIAQKGEKSGDHLERIWEMVRHMPGSTKGDQGFIADLPSGQYVFKRRNSPAVISVKHPDKISQSDVHGFTQTTSNPRGHSLTFVFLDEAAFVPKADEYYDAVKPAIDSTGGKIFITSTHSESDDFFYPMCYEGEITNWTVIADGILAWRCNGIPVLEIINRAMETRREEYVPPHGKPYRIVDQPIRNLYVKELHKARRANPQTQTLEPLPLDELLPVLIHEIEQTMPDGSKRIVYEVPDNWFIQSRPGMKEEKFDREYRCKRTPDNSLLIFNNFKRDFHVRDASEFPFIPDHPLIRGWDPGYKYAACVIGQVDKHGRFVVHYCVNNDDKAGRLFAQQVKSLTKIWFPNATTIIDYGDPSGSTPSTYSAHSYYDELKAVGIYVQYSYKHGFREDARIGHIKALLDLCADGIPMLVILNHRENKDLLKAMEHEYRWEANGDKVDKSRRPYADNVDALAYAVCQATAVPAEVNRKKSGFARPEIVKNANKKYAGSRKFKPVAKTTRYR